MTGYGHHLPHSLCRAVSQCFLRFLSHSLTIVFKGWLDIDTFMKDWSKYISFLSLIFGIQDF